MVKIFWPMCARKQTMFRRKQRKSLLVLSMSEKRSFLKINKNGPQLLIVHTHWRTQVTSHICQQTHNLFTPEVSYTCYFWMLTIDTLVIPIYCPVKFHPVDPEWGRVEESHSETTASHWAAFSNVLLSYIWMYYIPNVNDWEGKRQSGG